ncbi:MAG: bifunctional phosphoribosylaminoimidazolecarboxamide formyltransferase/IMP cyclohydrolase [bacterium]|nr:bifunctional phosphoribosylaminoimidazolecarboxamide formyltransferase/IMP cyclohydrolase [bacterium]
MPKIKTALISVYDKTGIVEFARKLTELGVDIISTGGTSRTLKENNIEHIQVEDITKFPEVMGGRVKTLHPNVFMGILAKRDSDDHTGTLKEYDLSCIDMVIVNLYPFLETINKPGVTIDKAIEQIDIGGVALLRAAGKNYKDVIAVTNPDKYNSILEELQADDCEISIGNSLKAAADVFNVTSAYDTYIAEYLRAQAYENEDLPEDYYVQMERVQLLRYGENPHQKAAYYKRPGVDLPYEQLHGKELSYNNLIDIDSAIVLPNTFDEPAVAIIKHTNPCGVGLGGDLTTAYDHALATDPVSAFGGIIGCNRTLDISTAEKISKMFVEVVVAPDFAEEAFELLTKKKNLRLIKLKDSSQDSADLYEMKSVRGGFLMQERDIKIPDRNEYKVVTSRQPSEEEWKAMLFGWNVIKYVKSNAILYCNDFQTVGIGTGQMSRVDSAEIAVMKAGKAGLELKGTSMISDAFFPFRDGIDAAAKEGITSVIQPGGSIRDEEVIAAAEEHKIAMVFTGTRHFRH